MVVVKATGTVQRWTGLLGTRSTEKNSVPAAPFGVIGPSVNPQPLTGGSAASAVVVPTVSAGSDAAIANANNASQCRLGDVGCAIVLTSCYRLVSARRRASQGGAHRGGRLGRGER